MLYLPIRLLWTLFWHPGISVGLSSFQLEFWVFSRVLTSFDRLLVEFILKVMLHYNFLIVLNFWGWSLSFELFPFSFQVFMPWVFLECSKKAFVKWIVWFGHYCKNNKLTYKGQADLTWSLHLTKALVSDKMLESVNVSHLLFLLSIACHLQATQSQSSGICSTCREYR